MEEYSSLRNYNSDSSDSEKEKLPQQKILKHYSSYYLEKSFPSVDLAKAEIYKQYVYRTKRDSQDGVKLFYCCRVSRNCSAKLYLHLPGKLVIVRIIM